MPNPRSPSRFRAAHAWAIAAAALVAIACSSPGSGDDASEEPAPTEASTQEATEEVATEAAEVEIPDLVGTNAAIAYDELTALGFTNIQLGSVDENDTVVLVMANWEVVEQEPAAGETLSTDSTIVLMCTKK